MTTPQSEGVLLNEKPLQATIPSEKQNGVPEVNGHPPPAAKQAASESEVARDSSKMPQQAADEVSKNKNAFSANQALPSSDSASKDQQVSEPKVELKARDEGVSPTDTEMPDVPATDKAEDSTAQPAGQPDLTTDSAPDPSKPEPTESKPDVEMADVGESPRADTNALEEAPAGSTDQAKGTPAATGTADVSGSEANKSSQASAKVPRERDVDSEDEPVAKRTKVEHGEQGGQGEAVKDAMEVDRQAASGQTAAQPEQPEDGEPKPKNLADDLLNDQPISEWQAKQIRAVLAGVKKTKVGFNFRLPVKDLWPMLWTEYSARIPNPVDISLMEKRLRGDGPPYATMGDFKKDLDLLVQNSITFNGDAHEVTASARACRESILSRMALHPPHEPPKPEKKETKAHTREPRAASTSKSMASTAAAKPVTESPVFAIPRESNGVPPVRRNPTDPESRMKRPVKPTHPKDLVYETKRKKKLPLELRFADEVLTELRKAKYYEFNTAFLQPVDPVALNIPSYHKIIKKPMDLGTMANKLAAGEYSNIKEFEKDFELIIKNCRTFNGEDHIVYHQALKLQDLYRAEMSKKDVWMAKHAPPVQQNQARTSPHRDDSDSDDADSEPDVEDEELKQSRHRLATIQKRLEEEQKKINEMVNSGTAEIADVEITQAVVAMLQKQLMAERAKIAALEAKKPAKSKSKSKKSGGSGSSHKKGSVSGGGATGGAKKSAPKKVTPKRRVTQAEKEVIVDSLGNLQSPWLDKAIDLIKKDTGQGENDSGELELDIDSLSEDALAKLYDIVIKAFPHLKVERQQQQQTSAAADPPKKPNKTKKNKPMSKTEQERRIQQLNELRAQAVRGASASQEPIESIEGNGIDAVAQHHDEHESDESVDSEEE
ncbi:uncharacterized protein CTHT_0000880 [Thermochaetoides thermophila DSM 1495]|uniref:Uncharacterized protein n=1 Tax=Chaetomium thermophilum (strain DSM 1495 / CBS 144.50 / IMI 039719) TaxID=759272 RepID=G0RYX1_CHATD|nr:hypothetical protein CTHT_0000880 [Thermochaetoides thermophila DSM 1495]EGS23399.1 hypothetical protein CTHT_0000880 [Thermochaetoides thermophila DSM 1495]